MTDHARSRPDGFLAGASAAHRAFVATLRRTDWDPAASSQLPGWTLGHLTTHVARNADALTGLYVAAARGEIGVQYPGGREQRAADIEAGAPRSRDELIDDVVGACERLEAAWSTTSDHTWRNGVGQSVIGPLPLAEWPYRRWRETEVHHVDLGLGFGVDDWSAGFVAEEWPRSCAGLAERLVGVAGCSLAPHDSEPVTIGATSAVSEVPTLRASTRELLGWMLGRHAITDAPDLEAWG